MGPLANFPVGLLWHDPLSVIWATLAILKGNLAAYYNSGFVLESGGRICLRQSVWLPDRAVPTISAPTRPAYLLPRRNGLKPVAILLPAAGFFYCRRPWHTDLELPLPN